jgi:ribosomal protein S18 acetylase RimI-like enzyme
MIILRKALIKDLNIILDIYKSAIEVLDSNGIAQWDDIYPSKEIITNDILDNYMFVGEIDNQIVSVFVLNQICDDEYANGNWQYQDASFYVVHRLCVNPEFQGKGIGRMIMMLIEDMLKNNGVQTIRLDAFSMNPVALRLYETLGFQKVGEVTWRKGLFYLFEKKI